MSPNDHRKRAFFWRLLRAPRASWSLIKAFDLAAKDRPDDALYILNRVQSDYEGRYSKFHLLRAYVSHRVSDFRLSVDDCDVVIDLIEAAKKSTPNGDYQLLYAVWLKDLSLRALELPGIEDTRWDDRLQKLKLDRVSSHLKRDFPLTWHPDWPDADENATSA